MAGGDDEESQDPIWRDNLLRQRIQTAVNRAESAVSNIGGDSGNPLTAQLSALEAGAWDSPSSERQTFVDDLDGVGQAIKGAFDSAVGELEGDLAAEPMERIDINEHPDLEWKTTNSGIDGRIPFGGYY